MKPEILGRVGAVLACLAAGPASAQAPRLGTMDFPTSWAPAARAPFIRGVLLLHSFEYGDAARAFREAQRLDSGFALAYWGEAMTYTHPVWNEQDGNAVRAALQRLAATRDARRAKASTRREQAYLDAVEILYGDGSKAVRDTAYSLAMGRLVARFPADREAKVFYALSLLGLNQGVRDVPTYLRAAAIVDTVFRSIITALHRGEKIELRGFGSFRLRRREPRKGRNPKTGDKVDVPPKKVPYFKPGKELKELINKETAPAATPAGEPGAPPDAMAV